MARRDQYQELGEPVKIGLLMDNPAHFSDPIIQACKLVGEQYQATGRFERGFEFIPAYPWGPPAGFIDNTIRAFNELCDRGCIAVMGGTHSDDAIALPPHVDERQVPFLAMGATAQSMSKWSFSVGWGSIPHDSYLIAGWLNKERHKRVVLTWDRADHCLEYVTHFRTACARAGVAILADFRFPQIMLPELEDIFEATLKSAKALSPDALVHFSTGLPAAGWVGFVTRSGWSVPRIMNGSFYGAAYPHRLPDYEGWVGTSMWDDANQLAAKFSAEFKARYPEAGDVPRELLALSYDAARAVIEGIILAPILTPDGVRRGLETVQLLPSACGGARTCIGFAPHAHRGHQGPDVMVLRRVKDGRNIMEGRAQLF